MHEATTRSMKEAQNDDSLKNKDSFSNASMTKSLQAKGISQ